MQYSIEARQLTNDSTRRPAPDSESQQVMIEARNAGEAISKFVRTTDAELISLHSVRGRETIATVRKADSVFLLRVYAN